jgi:hypothetical protein
MRKAERFGGCHMRKANQPKGIFSIEGRWNRDLRSPLTIRPALDLLKTVGDVPFIHQTCATPEELNYYLHQWILTRYDGYPILYLASHGDEYGIELAEKFVSLDEIAEVLKDGCSSRILMIASCSTLAIDKRHLKRFLQQTGALMICGYSTDVDWLKSTAFEIMLLSEMQENEFSGRGIDAIQKKLMYISKSFPELHFRMVTDKG